MWVEVLEQPMSMPPPKFRQRLIRSAVISIGTDLAFQRRRRNANDARCFGLSVCCFSMAHFQNRQAKRVNQTSAAGSSLEELEAQIQRATHWLPSQGPIEVFVHHNTLHVFESDDFHQAVVAGYHRYGGHPYLPEPDYRNLVRAGRIETGDLRQVLENLYSDSNTSIADLGAPLEIRMALLTQPMPVEQGAELRWVVAETDALDTFLPQASSEHRKRVIEGARQSPATTVDAIDRLFSNRPDWVGRYGSEPRRWKQDAWESFALHDLFQACSEGVSRCRAEAKPASLLRPRDWLLQIKGEDIDRHVQDVLIRFCGAFVDQGYSDWSLPSRDQGFYEAFVQLYSGNALGLPRWLQGLPKELEALQSGQVSALECLRDSLQAFNVAATEQEEFLAQSLLALRGWAGMVWQLEAGVDWVVHTVPPGSLIGLLAIQLLLERQACLYFGNDGDPTKRSLDELLGERRPIPLDESPRLVPSQAFQLFQLAQMRGWSAPTLRALTDDDRAKLMEVVSGFSSFERRRVFQEAYEKKYREAALNAFARHWKYRRTLPGSTDRPRFQIVTCIDDREESFRRHLEEVDPACETFGAAGFFAVAIHYRGASDSFYKPLCPGVITPDHYVQEDVGYTFEGVHRNRTELRKRLGYARHLFHTGSRTFLGGILAGIVGSLATIPLVARVLFPRMTARLQRTFGSILQPPPFTRLQMERYLDPPGPDNGNIGFKTDEMADIVVRLLQDIGLTAPDRFSRLVVICGHGSSSLNNPHESAYCCGACAGKRGGPNARAFAAMANDFRVRQEVLQRGIRIPDDTVFVGAYHNTCDDSVVYYDLDGMPASHHADFEGTRARIEEARRRNAHERCRRFASAPLELTESEALGHVEARAQDISQARPEYNHATNALCLVGKRDWTRGLFLDRRAFLTSYDPTQDDSEYSILYRILSAALPVCAGINLEYYFSCVDYNVYGSGSKLPHNVVSMLGVMEGTSSDLRTGLYQQMVEIHEPLRILFVVETTPEAIRSIMDRNPGIRALVRNRWVQLATLDPIDGSLKVFQDGSFQPFTPWDTVPNWSESSRACYQGSRESLPFFSIREGAAG